METASQETEGAGINNSQDQILSLVKTTEDPEKKWEYVINYFETLNAKITKLDTENEELRAGLASANGKISYLENQKERSKQR